MDAQTAGVIGACIAGAVSLTSSLVSLWDRRRQQRIDSSDTRQQQVDVNIWKLVEELKQDKQELQETLDKLRTFYQTTMSRLNELEEDHIRDAQRIQALEVENTGLKERIRQLESES